MIEIKSIKNICKSLLKYAIFQNIWPKSPLFNKNLGICKGFFSFPQFNPKNPVKPGLNQFNPPGWVFGEKPGFLNNPASSPYLSNKCFAWKETAQLNIVAGEKILL